MKSGDRRYLCHLVKADIRGTVAVNILKRFMNVTALVVRVGVLDLFSHACFSWVQWGRSVLDRPDALAKQAYIYPFDKIVINKGFFNVISCPKSECF